jgi:hypothetical protein
LANLGHFFPTVSNLQGTPYTPEQMEQAIRFQSLLQVSDIGDAWIFSSLMRIFGVEASWDSSRQSDGSFPASVVDYCCYLSSFDRVDRQLCTYLQLNGATYFVHYNAE